MNSFKLRRKIDPIIPTIGIGLSIIGLVMILSASQIIAAERFGDPYYFFVRQLISWVIGMAAFFYFSKVPLEKLFQWRNILLIVSLVALVMVFLPFIGGKVNGVYRWVGVGPLTFQPSEFVKVFLIIYFAGLFAVKGEAIRSFSKGFLPFALVLAAVTLLIGLGKDLDTLVAIAATSLIMFFVAKSRWWHTLLIVLVGAVAVGALILLEPYRAERLDVFLSNDVASRDIRDTGYHSQQALIAIGSGGMWGSGFGQGISKYKYLPESYTDSIFAVIAEELGFVRSAVILLAFLVVAWRGFIAASLANSKFAQLIAIGSSSLIIIQALINIGGMLNVIPLSGLPLPFVSYGGSALIASLAILGLLTNISGERR
ncbi:MAG: putative lipid II flippase FtsW [Patescibacteria group bacterium]